MNTCETCRYYSASPLQEPCESCIWDYAIGQEPSNWEAPTNADRIRSMSDEELAKTMHDMTLISTEIGLSTEWWEQWLKSPVEPVEVDNGT